MELWKEITGYEGLYEVSSLGRVRSLDHWVKNRYSVALRHGRILRQAPDRAGYMQVGLSNRDKVTTSKVHRLVAAAFIGTPATPEETVNHLDFKKDNNCAENLEWCSGKENLRHAWLAGRFDGAIRPKRGKKLNVRKVHEIKRAHAAGEATKSIAARFSIAHQTVTRVVNGSIWSRA